MRKVLSIVFLFVFLFNIIGYYPLFLLRQQHIRSEIASIIENNLTSGKLVRFIFSDEELAGLSWIKENEFRYKDEMYDIVFTKPAENGKSHLYCISDTKEKSLLTNLRSHISRETENGNSPQGKKQITGKPMLKDYCPPKNDFQFAPFLNHRNYFSIDEHYVTVIIDRVSPPPKFS